MATGTILLATSASAQEARLRQLFAAAQEAQREGNLAAAAEHYEAIVSEVPDLAEAHANLGSIYYELRQDDKAESALERAATLKPTLAAPHFFLGVIAARQGDHAGAVTRLEESARLDPSNPLVSFYLGEERFALGRYVDAVISLNRAVALSDVRTDAYYYLSKAYSELAKAAGERLEREFPGSFFVHLSRGYYHEARKEWGEARSAYEAAVRKKPQAASASARLQWVSARAEGSGPGTPPPAVADPQSSLLGVLYGAEPVGGVETWLAELAAGLQSSHQQGGTEENAYREAERFRIASYLAARWIDRNDPRSYRAHQMRAQMHEALGEPDKAVREYRAALSLRPDLQNMRFAIGSLLWSLSRFDEALPEVEAELRVNPHHAEAHYVLADILLSQDRSGEAKQHLLEALRIQPGLAEAHLAIERIHFADGEYEKSLDHLRTAARLSPADPAPHYRLWTLYRRLGDRTAAEAALTEFRRLQAARGDAPVQ